MIFLEYFYPSVLMNRKADITKGLGHSISYMGDITPRLHSEFLIKRKADIKWGNYSLPLGDNIQVFLNQGTCNQSDCYYFNRKSQCFQ